MQHTTLIIGGCRSGKSRYALNLANSSNGRRKVFLATCVPQDEEMDLRVQRHKAERGSEWKTIEEPLKIHHIIRDQDADTDILVVDCLTLWVTNLVLAHEQDAPALRAAEKLCQAIKETKCPLCFVTNEVGTGIVPGDPLSRRFRDLTGLINQRVAEACDQVVWMVAGIGVIIKPTSQTVI